MSAQLSGAGVMTPLAVGCPACHARVGRPCCNPRGYLVATHKRRAQRWLDQLAGKPVAAAPGQRQSQRRGAQLPPVSSDELVLF